MLEQTPLPAESVDGFTHTSSSDVILVDVAGNEDHESLAFSETTSCERGQLVLKDLPITSSHM